MEAAEVGEYTYRRVESAKGVQLDNLDLDVRENGQLIIASINRFVEEQESGLGSLVEKRKKEDRSIPEGKFVLGVQYGEGKDLTSWGGQFYFDGDYSFVLGFTPKEHLENKHYHSPEWLATVGFSGKDEIKDPMIVQLQSKRPYEGEPSLRRDLLSSFNWNHLMIDIVALWRGRLDIRISICSQQRKTNGINYIAVYPYRT